MRRFFFKNDRLWAPPVKTDPPLSPDGMKWGLTEVSQKSHRRPTEPSQKTPKLDDFRVIWRPPIFGFETPDFRVFPVILRCFSTAQKHFAGLKEVLQSSVISASA